MITYILVIVLPKAEYFARFVVVVFPVFAALKYGQTTLRASTPRSANNSRAIHLDTDLSTGTVSR